MKKLLTIVCALSLVMAFTLPAMAIDDIEDNQAAVALLGQTNQAQKGGEIDNDGLDLDTGPIAVNNDGNTIGNTDDNSTDNSNQDNTNVDVKTGDLLSGNTDDNSTDNSNQDNTNVDVAVDDITVTDVANDKSVNDNDLLDNKEGTIEVSDIANDKSQDNDDNSTNDSWNTDNSTNDSNNTDNSEDNDVAVDVAFDDVVDMKGNEAAAAFGGTAIAVDIDDIELNLASTTSVSGIYQSSSYEANAGALFGEAETEFKSECLHVDAKIEGNTGIVGGNFSAGNFNNQANLNNVTMTIQY